MLESNIAFVYNSVPYFIPYFEKNGIKVYSMYKKIPSFFKIIRKFSLLTNIYTHYWFDNWYKDKNIRVVIFFASIDISPCLNYLNVSKNIRVIFWYWNPVSKTVNPNILRHKNCELWSFDKKDCVKHNLNFNTTFYFDTININSSTVKYDIFFVGINKGRKKILDSINAKFISQGLKTYFHLINEDLPKQKRLSYLSYQDNLSIISQSRAILDIVQEGQTGMTLRIMECIFFKKKLITNQLSIIEEDFYCEDNCFIIGQDNFEKIHAFLEKPYVEISKNIINKYNFKEWLNRFDLKN